MKVAVLDDYQGKAQDYADWSILSKFGISPTFYTDILGSNPLPDSVIPLLVDRLLPYDIVVCMRERTPMPRKVLEKLPNLKLLFTTGLGNASFDMAAATELGIPVCGSHMIGNGTSELTWGLILALLRKIPQEDRVFKYEGGWQTKMGFGVQGKTLGLVGLGRLGTETARVALAFGMKVTAWSANLTEARVSATGLDVSLAPSLESLLSTSDIVSLHLVLSPTTRQIISRARLGLMKPSAFLINTSRGGLIDQDAMCDALEAGTIAGVGLDTFEVEPVPKDARIRKVAREQADRVVITPHIGYVEDENYKVAYKSIVSTIEAWAEGKWSLPVAEGQKPANNFLNRLLNKTVVPKI